MENEIWQETIAIIQKDLSKESFNRWIKPIQPISFTNDHLQIGVPNIFFKEKLEDNYHFQLGKIISGLRNKKTSISFVVSPTVKEYYEKNLEKKESFYKETNISFVDKTNLNPKYTFESFVVGETNQFAHAASAAAAEAPGKTYNPLLIYGGVGLGKTHLMHAIGHKIYQTNPRAKIIYVSSEQFMNEFIDSIRYDKSSSFKNKYRNVDVLLVDDIQFLESKEGTQNEFFHTFNALYETQKQIVLSSDRPAKDIPTLEDRLRSRFEWGLITDIQPPTLETRIAILKKLLEDENIDIPDDVLHFIANRIKTNIRELEGALISIIAYVSLSPSTKIDLALVKNRLSLVRTEETIQSISIDSIQKKISKYFKIQSSDLKNKKRNITIVHPRMIAMYLCRELTGHSTTEIGREFGGRDHSTVIHACSKIKELLEKDVQFKNRIDSIVTDLKGCG